MSYAVGDTVRFGKQFHIGIVRYIGRVSSGSIWLGLQSVVPLPYDKTRFTGDGGVITGPRDDSAEPTTTQLFGPCTPGHAVFVLASSVYPAQLDEARRQHAAVRIQALQRGVAYRRGQERIYQQAVHSLEEREERVAIEAAQRIQQSDKLDGDVASLPLDVLDVESLQAAVLPGGGAGSSSGVGGAADVLAALMSPRLHRRVSSTASVSVDASYTGVHLEFPLKPAMVAALRDSFAHHQLLHQKYVLQLLHRFAETLDPSSHGNVLEVTVPVGTKLVVVGDVHGQLQDVLHIFHTHGVPSSTNRYLFNGDLVDRGDRGLEVFLLCAAYRVLHPESIIIHRGNHEDVAMNKTSGFEAEVFTKYGTDGGDVVYARFQSTFLALPLASVVDGKVLVVHGGLSDEKRAGIQTMRRIHRLKPIPTRVGDINSALSRFDKVFECMMWADPSDEHEGTAFNQARNCAVTWGPDVTRRFLRQTSLELIIRSHQVVPGGIQMSHGDRVLTLFSASNYCGGSYDGATLVLEPGFDVAALAKRCCPARFTHNVKPLVQTHSLMPRKALLEAGQGDYSEFVRACLAAEAIMTRRDELFDHFSEQDTQRTGDLSYTMCTDILNDVVPINVDWHKMLRSFPVPASPDECFIYRKWGQTKVRYQKLLDRFRVAIPNGFAQGMQHIISARLLRLYRATSRFDCCDTAKQWCNAFELSSSGEVTLPEFIHVCRGIGVDFSENQLFGIGQAIDTTGNGTITFAEVQACFQIEVSSSAFPITGEWAVHMLNVVAESLFMHFETAAEAFQGTDTNEDHLISFDEFSRFLDSLHLKELPPADYRRLFDALDVNRDGGIDKHEFFGAFKFGFHPSAPRRATARATAALVNADAQADGGGAGASAKPDVAAVDPPVPPPATTAAKSSHPAATPAADGGGRVTAASTVPTVPARRRSFTEPTPTLHTVAGGASPRSRPSAMAHVDSHHHAIDRHTHSTATHEAASGAGAGAGAGAGSAAASAKADPAVARVKSSLASPVRSPSAEDAARQGASVFVDRIVQQIAVEMHRFSTTLQEMFVVLTGGSGKAVNERQFQRALARLRIGTNSAMQRLTQAEVRVLFEAIDQNRDGFIDANEFMAAFKVKDTVLENTALDRRTMIKRRRSNRS